MLCLTDWMQSKLPKALHQDASDYRHNNRDECKGEKLWGKQMISIQSTHLVGAHKPSRVITELSQEMNFLFLQRLCYVKCKNINKTLPDLILCLWGCTFAFVRGFWVNPAKWITEILKRLVLRFIYIFLHLKTSSWFALESQQLDAEIIWFLSPSWLMQHRSFSSNPKHSQTCSLSEHRVIISFKSHL